MRLHDHVDVDVALRQLAEDLRRDPWMVRQPIEGDLGLVAAVGHARNDPLLHDLLLVADDGPCVPGAGLSGLDKTRQHPHRHPPRHGQLDGAGLQHLGPQGGHLQHFLIGDAAQAPGSLLDPRIGGVDPVHVGVDVARRLQGGGDRHGGGVRAAAAQGGEPPVAGDPLESSDHRHFAGVQRRGELLGRNLVDAGLAVGVVGDHRHLPAEPRARRHADVAQGHGQEAAGDLLA